MREGGTRPATLRSVAMPAEHGGWGLTLEPGLLGVLVAPSAAGLLLAVAALLVFLARTPVRHLMVAWRHVRSGRSAMDATSGGRAERRRLAWRVAGWKSAAWWPSWGSCFGWHATPTGGSRACPQRRSWRWPCGTTCAA